MPTGNKAIRIILNFFMVDFLTRWKCFSTVNGYNDYSMFEGWCHDAQHLKIRMFLHRQNHFKYFMPFVLGVADLAPGLITYSQNEPLLLLHHFNLSNGLSIFPISFLLTRVQRIVIRMLLCINAIISSWRQKRRKFEWRKSMV